MKRTANNAVSESAFGRRVLAVVAAAVLLPLVLALVLGANLALEQSAAFERRLLTAVAHQQALALQTSPQGIPRELAQQLNGHYAALLNETGRLVYSSVAVSEDFAALLATATRLPHDQVDETSRDISWYADSAEWRGVLRTITREDAGRRTREYLLVYEPVPRWYDSMVAAAPLTAWLLVGGIVAALAAALYLMRCYVPALRALQSALRALADGGQVAVPTQGVDEVAKIATQLRVTAAATSRRLAAHAAQAEVDCALLGTLEVDQGIEAALPKLLTMTLSRAVGVILVDEVTSSHGRLLLAGEQEQSLPVERVMLDAEMLVAVSAAPEGMTVARVEQDRHGFLVPFTYLGAGFFWLWPVMRNDKLLALLVVGFEHEPVSAGEGARHGATFAHRLRLALSQSARDEALYRQAHFDPLTQLPNRSLFQDRLSQELAAALSGLVRGALLFVDLDHFKRINDTLGHEAGDQLLVIVAQRLKSCVKEGDTVARLGGDEFTIILRHISDPDAARAVAERIIYSLNLPVNLAGRDHHVRASVGVALFPDDGATVEDLMRNADLAMYRAKELGRGQSIFYERNMSVRTMRQSDSGLYRALKRRELSLFYQPQFHVANVQLAGAEALLRWQTRYDGMKLPNEFIPSAEQTGLIVDIGSWVLETACAQLAEWRRLGLPQVRLAVNVSAQQLIDDEFAERVERLLAQNRLPPSVLELELTETALVDAQVGAALKDLAELGVSLAIDDFGTGFSSLNYLRRHPIHTVKLDASFLEEVPADASAAAVAESVLTMAHSLGKSVVAEGVETMEQLEFLRRHRCAYAQGFFLARPMSVAAMTEQLEARRMGTIDEDERATG
ncbi:MAG: EAL domain-containing protein [Pseudomonadales bacterium]|nr:EAL domain-containing protein [Pseudomonadales bacterium]